MKHRAENDAAAGKPSVCVHLCIWSLCEEIFVPRAPPLLFDPLASSSPSSLIPRNHDSLVSFVCNMSRSRGPDTEEDIVLSKVNTSGLTREEKSAIKGLIGRNYRIFKLIAKDDEVTDEVLRAYLKYSRPPPSPEHEVTSGRKRTRTGSLPEDVVFHLQTAAPQHTHSSSTPESSGTVIKTCFYVGTWEVLEGVSHGLWVTTLHQGLELRMQVSIFKNLRHCLFGTVVYIDPLSDIAIIAGDPYDGCEPLRMSSTGCRVLDSVVITGLGDDEAVLLPYHISWISSLNDPPSHPQKHLRDIFSQWRTNRFFLVNQTANVGFSGAPIVDQTGDVVGMLCASEYVGTSWALKSNFLVDALQECKKAEETPHRQ